MLRDAPLSSACGRHSASVIGSIAAVLLLSLAPATGRAGGPEDMDFVAEHLPEAMMDARLLSLPIDFPTSSSSMDLQAQVQAFAARVETGSITLSGPGVGLGLRRQLTEHWSLTALAFFDRLDVSGAPEERRVAPIFSATFPVSLPADASLEHQRGDQTQYGTGFSLRYQPESDRFGMSLGVLRQRVSLNGYRVDYHLLSGPDAGASGTLDYSADYSFWVPFASVEWRLVRSAWQFAPKLTAALPLPQRGWQGRMTGAGFDVRGDTASIGRGRHMGDPFAGFGLGVTYSPWHLTMDAGALLDQALVEPRIHRGIDRAWLIDFSWSP